MKTPVPGNLFVGQRGSRSPQPNVILLLFACQDLVGNPYRRKHSMLSKLCKYLSIFPVPRLHFPPWSRQQLHVSEDKGLTSFDKGRWLERAAGYHYLNRKQNNPHLSPWPDHGKLLCLHTETSKRKATLTSPALEPENLILSHKSTLKASGFSLLICRLV